MCKLSPLDKIAIGGLVAARITLSEVLEELMKQKTRGYDEVNIDFVVALITKKTTDELNNFLKKDIPNEEPTNN